MPKTCRHAREQLLATLDNVLEFGLLVGDRAHVALVGVVRLETGLVLRQGVLALDLRFLRSFRPVSKCGWRRKAADERTLLFSCKAAMLFGCSSVSCASQCWMLRLSESVRFWAAANFDCDRARTESARRQAG